MGGGPPCLKKKKKPARTFPKQPPSEKAKLRRCRTYLSQLRLSVHHIQGVKGECADYISRKNFDDMMGASSEHLVNGAFSAMDVHLDLNMTMIRPKDGLQQVQFLREFGDIYERLEKRLEPALVNKDQWKGDKTYLWHEDRIVVPSKRIPALPTKRGATQQRSTPHTEGPTHHHSTRRHTRRHSAIQRSTPHHAGGHTATQHALP